MNRPDQRLFRLARKAAQLVVAARKQSEPEPAPHARVELFHWKPASGGHNFGDHLSKIIVTKILADRGLFLEQSALRPARLLALGSILHFGKSGDVVWGSGINGKIKPDNLNHVLLDVRAVRGPLTREVLISNGIKCPAIYGDPALLLPTLLGSRYKADPTKDIVVVPNLHDESLVQGREYVSPRLPWNKVLEQILSARLVVASSLHGLILADAFGVPSRYVRLSATESLFKYEDYYEGSGRRLPKVAMSIDEALAMGGSEPLSYNPKPLLDVFPFDLWGDEREDR